jgi:hypothetical protein
MPFRHLQPDQYVDSGMLFYSDTTAEEVKHEALKNLLHDFECDKKPRLAQLSPKIKHYIDKRIGYLQMLNGLSAAAIQFQDITACHYALECAEKTGDYALLTETARRIASAATIKPEIGRICLEYLREKNELTDLKKSF